MDGRSDGGDSECRGNERKRGVRENRERGAKRDKMRRIEGDREGVKEKRKEGRKTENGKQPERVEEKMKNERKRKRR